MGKLQLKLYASLIGCPVVIVMIAWRMPSAHGADILLRLGVLLELAGIGRVLFEVSQTAAKYGRPTILHALGLRKPKASVMAYGVAVSQEASMSMVVHRNRKAETLEERVKLLEEDVKEFGDKLTTHEKATDKSLTELRAADRDTKDLLERSIASLKAEVKDVASGGIESEYWWGVLFAFGLILTNYNNWIAGWFAR